MKRICQQTLDRHVVQMVYEEAGVRLSYTDQLNILTQMLFSDDYGIGVIDIWNQQKKSIEEIQMGLSGLASKTYDFHDELLDEAINDKKISYSKDSIHILVSGTPIRISALSFGSDDELQRVLRNLLKNTTAGELTVKHPDAIVESVDGRRISVVRPPMSDAWCGLIRKFDTVSEITIKEWCRWMEEGDKVAAVITHIVHSGANMAFTGEMSTGKTTILRGALFGTKKEFSIRTVESETLELNARRFLPGRNVMALRITEETDEKEVLGFIRKSTGQVFCVGEVNNAPMANLSVNLSKIARQLMLSAHYIQTEDMIADFTNAKLTEGGYTDEILAEMDAVRSLQFDVHLQIDGGLRYVSSINEIVPDFDFNKGMSNAELNIENTTSESVRALRNIGRQLGKKQTYVVRPIMRYNNHDKRLEIINSPSEQYMVRAKAYMNPKMYDEFEAFFAPYKKEVAAS